MPCSGDIDLTLRLKEPVLRNKKVVIAAKETPLRVGQLASDAKRKRKELEYRLHFTFQFFHFLRYAHFHEPEYKREN